MVPLTPCTLVCFRVRSMDPFTPCTCCVYCGIYMAYVSVVGSNPWSYLHPVLESVLGSNLWSHLHPVLESV